MFVRFLETRERDFTIPNNYNCCKFYMNKVKGSHVPCGIERGIVVFWTEGEGVDVECRAL